MHVSVYLCFCVCVRADMYVSEMDTCSSINKPAHLTNNYSTDVLVVRRGFEVFFRVTFSRLLTEADEFQLEFLIGESGTSDLREGVLL